MPKSDLIERRDEKFAAQLILFKNAIAEYAAKLDVTEAQITEQAADADRYAYELTCQQIASGISQQWTAWKDITRRGGATPAAAEPQPPTWPDAVPAVPPGVEQRFRKLVRAIKAHPNYNPAIGQALGIEAPTQAVPDLAALTPVLRLTITGGQVVIQSSWQGQSKFLDQIEFQVDRGTGQGFQWLAYSTLPKHRDATPFPATAAKWSYRAIYRVGDSRVGQWSAIASITVVA